MSFNIKGLFLKILIISFIGLFGISIQAFINFKISSNSKLAFSKSEAGNSINQLVTKILLLEEQFAVSGNKSISNDIKQHLEKLDEKIDLILNSNDNLLLTAAQKMKNLNKTHYKIFKDLESSVYNLNNYSSQIMSHFSAGSEYVLGIIDDLNENEIELSLMIEELPQSHAQLRDQASQFLGFFQSAVVCVQNLFIKNNANSFLENKEKIFKLLKEKRLHTTSQIEVVNEDQYTKKWQLAQNELDLISPIIESLFDSWTKREKAKKNLLENNYEFQKQSENIVETSTTSMLEQLNFADKFSLISALGVGFCLFLFSFIIAVNITKPIGYAVKMLKDISQGSGDLTKKINNVTSKDEIGELAQYFNAFIDKLAKIVKGAVYRTKTLSDSFSDLKNYSEKVSKETVSMKEKSTDVSVSTSASLKDIDMISKSASDMYSNINSIASAMEQLNASIGEVTKNCHKEAEIASQAENKVSEAGEKMESLGNLAAEMTKIVDSIKDIAAQTNLLALNAAIEAAAAGEAGRGFSVVANEVKELAHQTETAIGEISEKITVIQDNSRDVVSVTKKVSEIINNVNSVSKNIANAMEEQTASVNEVSKSIEFANKSAAEIAESSSKASQNLYSVSQNIKEMNEKVEFVADDNSSINKKIADMTNIVFELKEGILQFKI